MHELSIAQSIIDIVHQYVPANDRPQVKTVFVKVGKLAGIVPDSLEFNFSAITADTPLANARLTIEHIPFTIQCNVCNIISEQEAGTVLCPQCGSLDTHTLTGTELQVTAIDVNEPEEVE